MSAAISRLHLEQAPAVVIRVGNGNVTLWRIRCYHCQWLTKAHALISLALAEQHWHAEVHNHDARLLLAEQRRDRTRQKVPA